MKSAPQFIRIYLVYVKIKKRKCKGNGDGRKMKIEEELKQIKREISTEKYQKNQRGGKRKQEGRDLSKNRSRVSDPCDCIEFKSAGIHGDFRVPEIPNPTIYIFRDLCIKLCLL